jgi:aspartate/methionine/tyrosine aminotransferase
MRPEPFALERFFARHEFSARHLLSTSDCQGLEMESLLALADDDLRTRWRGLTLGYTESQGLPELREQVAAAYESVAPAELLIAAPEEAVFLAMNAILEPGDRVICTFPGYQSLYQLALSIGCEVDFWEPVESEGWRFDPDRLEELLGPATKLVVWNFPHNPTGALPSHHDYERMIALAEKAGAWVFSDEMYRLLELSPGSRLPAAVDRYERAISLAGMSKAFGLAGLRLGWVATHDGSLLERMAGLKDYTTICAPAPSELLALMALRNPMPILDAHRARVAANISTAAGFFARNTGIVRWIPPEAGTVCFPRLLDGPASEAPPSAARGAAAFCDKVLRDTEVLLLPSTMYGYGDSHFRLGLGREDFAAGLTVLEAYLAAMKDPD